MESNCRDVGQAAEIISNLLTKEKQVNSFLKNIDPVHFELCLRATYLNHYLIHSDKEALEVVSACIFQNLKREANYFELLEHFSTVFAKFVLGRYLKFCLLFNSPLGVHLVAALSVALVIVFWLDK